MPSSLPSGQQRTTLKRVCHFTLKFLPAVRNVLWTKELHHTLRFLSWIISVKKNGMHLKGILIRTRSICSSWANFGSETPVEQKISQRRYFGKLGFSSKIWVHRSPELSTTICDLLTSFLFLQIKIFRSRRASHFEGLLLNGFPG